MSETKIKTKSTKQQFEEYKREAKDIQKNINQVISVLKRTKVDYNETDKLKHILIQKILGILIIDTSVINPLASETVLKKDGQIQKYNKKGLPSQERDHLLSLLKELMKDSVATSTSGGNAGTQSNDKSNGDEVDTTTDEELDASLEKIGIPSNVTNLKTKYRDIKKQALEKVEKNKKEQAKTE